MAKSPLDLPVPVETGIPGLGGGAGLLNTVTNWAPVAGIATNFLSGLFGGDDQEEINQANIAANRETALRNEQLAREEMQQRWELEQQRATLAREQQTQQLEEQSRQFAHQMGQNAGQFKSKSLGEILGQQSDQALTRDKLGLEATQLDPLAQQKSRQKNAVMAALMGGAAPYNITPSADVFGPQGMPTISGGLQIPEGGFGEDVMAFFSPEARASAEGNFANAVAAVNPSLPTPDFSALGYGAAGAGPAQASDAFRSLQESELQSAQQEHLNSVLSALGTGGGQPTFTPMSSASAAPQASDALGSPTTPESFIGEAGDPKLDASAPTARYDPRTAPPPEHIPYANRSMWGGSERAMKDEPIPPDMGSGSGGGGIDPIAAYNAIKALLGKGKKDEGAQQPAPNGSIINAGRGRR